MGVGGGGFYYMKFVRFYNGIRRLGLGVGFITGPDPLRAQVWLAYKTP